MRPLDPAFDMGSRLAAMDPDAKLDFAMLAHDIRGALQGVFGGIAAIRPNDLPAGVREQLARIAAAARSIEGLSDALAVLNQDAETAASAQVDSEEVVIEEFLGYYRSRWAGEARSKRIGFEISAAGDLPAALRVPHLPLARVLGNLTNNAITYSGRGTVRLEACRGTGGGVVFRLTDQGPGLDDEALRKVSEEHDIEIGTNEDGHGLGLHIVRMLVRENGGRVSVRNREEGGVLAVVEFPPALCIDAPVLQAEPGLEPEPLPVRPPWDRPVVRPVPREKILPREKIVPREKIELAGMRILLAEDNPTNQMVATQMLTMLKAEVTLAADGVEALERFDEARFDMVVVDIEMPRMTGLDVIRTIRAMRDGRERTPIVALTAYALREHRDRIAEAGANGLISKPIASIEALAKGLAAHLVLPDDRPVPAPVPAPVSATVPDAAGADEAEEPVVDRAIYQTLSDAIGAEMMSELLEKVAADLTNARDELAGALESGDSAPIRAASHILISVAGAVGANRLQRCARRLNKVAGGEEFAAICELVPPCIAEIDAAVAFTAAERAEA